MDFETIHNVRKQIEAGSISLEDLKKAYEALSDTWLCQAMDLSRAQSILDGSWPNADTIIALHRQRRKEQDVAESSRAKNT